MVRITESASHILEKYRKWHWVIRLVMGAKQTLASILYYYFIAINCPVVHIEFIDSTSQNPRALFSALTCEIKSINHDGLSILPRK